ncbi:hypothetical protein CY34DRAFT_813783 [Suillus luteus UH-Slu-Lm8-n1]|uniref:Uncharacterized protein n=1 Tax=Suillus luteus UH-Slu-Lm8-n1 TaxID=930992 RepID=A0A0D0AMG9_9AGAM|nr:hypothetical protein CY34DRAFT_813783 [Suillus luteus UH-Slu-Lm8-n1]
MKMSGLRRIDACLSPDDNAWLRSEAVNSSISETTNARRCLSLEEIYRQVFSQRAQVSILD